MLGGILTNASANYEFNETSYTLHLFFNKQLDSDLPETCLSLLLVKVTIVCCNLLLFLKNLSPRCSCRSKVLRQITVKRNTYMYSGFRNSMTPAYEIFALYFSLCNTNLCLWPIKSLIFHLSRINVVLTSLVFTLKHHHINQIENWRPICAQLNSVIYRASFSKLTPKLGVGNLWTKLGKQPR